MDEENYYLLGEVNAKGVLMTMGEWRLFKSIIPLIPQGDSPCMFLGDSRIYRDSLEKTFDDVCFKIHAFLDENRRAKDTEVAGLYFTAIEKAVLSAWILQRDTKHKIRNDIRRCFSDSWFPITKCWTRVMYEILPSMTKDEFEYFEKYAKEHIEDFRKHWELIESKEADK